MKIIAIFAVLASSYLTALTIIQKEKLHCDTVKTSISYMVQIKNRALFYGESLTEIIIQLQEQGSKDNADYIYTFIPDEKLSPPESWESAINSSRILSQREKSLLISFGVGLCSCSKDDIEEYCDDIISQMSEIYKKLISEREKNTKLISALALSVGLTAVFIFI